MPSSFILITAADAAYFDLVKGTIRSIRDKPEGKHAPLAFFDLGCTEEQTRWLRGQVDIIKQADWEFDFPSKNTTPVYLKGLLARPFLRKYFPGYEFYVWIDADAWVQDWQAIDLFLEGARRRGLALVPEIDRGSMLQYGRIPVCWNKYYGFYVKSFGKKVAEQFRSFPMLNAGVFALHQDAPHWLEWAHHLHIGLQGECSVVSDQTALNLTVYGRGLFQKTELLPAWCNWTCHYGMPAWDVKNGLFVEPYLPHHPIGIVHLTCRKHERALLRTTDGGVADVGLRYPPDARAVPETKTGPEHSPFPIGDYVSPGLSVVQADRFFPNMIIGDKNRCPWPYLRRGIPHNWYVDRRYVDKRGSPVGFLSRDEAHILYNTALQFRGKKALEIGCWMGWSACHLGLAGVSLDVVDPILAWPEFHESVSGSLRAAGILGSTNLVGEASPRAVVELAKRHQRKWSLIFIDGDHDAPGPLEDAKACEPLAEDDAAILFHDLASPEVAQGLDYLKQRGWKTLVYQTMQIMGVAWRGNFVPVRHQPDPKVNWSMPAHLASYAVSGTTDRV